MVTQDVVSGRETRVWVPCVGCLSAAPEQSDAQQGGVSPPLPRLLFTRLFLPNWLTLVVFYDISRIYVCLLDGLCTQIYLPLFAIFHIHLSLNIPALRYVKQTDLVFLGYAFRWLLDIKILRHTFTILAYTGDILVKDRYFFACIYRITNYWMHSGKLTGLTGDIRDVIVYYVQHWHHDCHRLVWWAFLNQLIETPSMTLVGI